MTNRTSSRPWPNCGRRPALRRRDAVVDLADAELQSTTVQRAGRAGRPVAILETGSTGAQQAAAGRRRRRRRASARSRPGSGWRRWPSRARPLTSFSSTPVSCRSRCLIDVVDRQIDDHRVARAWRSRETRRRGRACGVSPSGRCRAGRVRARAGIGEQRRRTRRSRSTPARRAAARRCVHGPARRPRARPACGRRRAGRRRLGAARAIIGTTAIDTPGNSPAARRLPPRRGCRATSRPPPRWISSAVLCARKRDSVGQRAQPALHQVRAEVEEQQEAAEQEERDDQQRRDEADEDVREDQLAADPPQQPALGERRAARNEEVAGADRQRDAGDGVDDAEHRRHARRAPRRRRTRPASTARPTTIARPGSVRSSASHAPRRSRDLAASAQRSRRASGSCVDFAILTHVS